MDDWRSRWLVTVASDVGSRDGIGWEFLSLQGEPVWAVFREDGGPFPVFSAARGLVALPPAAHLEAMTRAAVDDLLAAPGTPDYVGWINDNVASALLLASCDVLSWEGEEWALESGDDDEPLTWAEPSDARIPFAWLRARGADRSTLIDIYQDDANFGLRFLSPVDRALPETDAGSWRVRRDFPLVTGRIHAVEVVYDTVVDGCWFPGLVTEILLHGDNGSTLLIAAEAYSRDEWHLYDESVVAVPDPAAADRLDWFPDRRRWRSTEAPA